MKFYLWAQWTLLKLENLLCISIEGPPDVLGPLDKWWWGPGPRLKISTESPGTWRMPWLLMSWLLVLPGHHQPWYMYWWCRINGFLYSMRNNFNYLCHLSIEKWNYVFMFPKDKLSTARVDKTNLNRVCVCSPGTVLFSGSKYECMSNCRGTVI